jgi:microsomal dipeptidase-like Zn-dependent dipeptidase
MGERARLSAAAERLHREAPLVDIHAHPSLKAWLFGRSLWRHIHSGATLDPFSSRSDFVVLERGGVGVICAAHHAPEARLLDDCGLLRFAAGAASLVAPNVGRIGRTAPYDILLEMMDELERQVARHPDRAEIARSAADIARIRGSGRIAVVHAVEGAGALADAGADADAEDSGAALARLEALAGRGVAILTLAHFYPNGLTSHVVGIPDGFSIRRVCDFDFGAGTGAPLTGPGRAFVGRMVELGVIVDLTHCTPAARAAVLAEVDGRRPVVASHVGVRALNPVAYNLSDEEIMAIARPGGGVGIIFMTRWLDAAAPGAGLASIARTIDHIRAVTGSDDHVMIGSDFDGFTDPPDDLADASWMGRLTDHLLGRGMSEDALRKLLGGNALRILEAGWR